jgi:hypothetical protein
VASGIKLLGIGSILPIEIIIFLGAARFGLMGIRNLPISLHRLILLLSLLRNALQIQAMVAIYISVFIISRNIDELYLER